MSKDTIVKNICEVFDDMKDPGDEIVTMTQKELDAELDKRLWTGYGCGFIAVGLVFIIGGGTNYLRGSKQLTKNASDFINKNL